MSLRALGPTVLAFVAIGALAHSRSGIPTGLSEALFEAFDRLGVAQTLPFFLAGVLGQWLINDPSRRADALALRQQPTAVLSWITALGIALVVPLPFGRPVPAAVFLCLAVFAAKWLQRRRGSAMLALIGQRSYFIYFAHFQVLLLMQASIGGLSWQPFSNAEGAALLRASFTLVIASTLGMAQLSHRWFEGPIMRAARSAF